MNNGPIYVLDDDNGIRSYLFAFLTGEGHNVECFETGDQLFARLATGAIPSVLLLDVLLPGCDGIEILNRLRKTGVQVPVVMLSGVSDLQTVVEAMKIGAANFLMKPFEDNALQAAIKEAVDEKVLLTTQATPIRDVDGFVSANPKMVRLREIVKRVAHTDVPILILGESGVGKEVIARYAHANSGRGDKPFVKVNCAALPDELLESELFGYERGAFTGAVIDKPGKFELADGGTLLLDEIGEMTAHLQAKLLHVLQDGTFSRLGARKPVRVDARIIASTNVKLEDAIRDGKFREDLYFRLNVIRVDLPPLRERPEDIPALCRCFIEKYREHYGSPRRELPPSLLDRCLRHNWPGNVRELENFIKRFLVLPDLPQIPDEREIAEEPPVIGSSSLLEVGAQAADVAQRRLMLQVLQETGWNRKQAAKRLNICYKALLNKVKRWNLDERQQARRAA